MINISNLKKTFYSALGEEKAVFNGLNLEINQGDFISVIGSNGAGKTTLLNTISGNIDLDDGYIEVDGKNINNLAKHKRGEFISKVYQNPALGTAPSMTIFENLSMADNKGKIFGLSLGLNYSRKEYYMNLLKELDLGLENLLDTEVQYLSGGQRQCLALIMATLNQPKVLLLDEHTAALDPKTSKIIMDKTEEIVKKSEIPTLMITHNLQDAIRYGNRLIMLHNGEIILDIKGKEKEELKKLIHEDAVTLDGRKVDIWGNIGSPNDVDAVIESGATGIGLYRTEFLFMNSDHFPTEEEQYQAYRVVAEKMQGKPVTIRTMDIGGDKELPYLDLPKELNPFLGYRAIRISLENKDMFKTQLRAILRASQYGQIKIMYPMISSVNEIRKANAILEECKKELDEIGKIYDRNIKVGIMVETPSTAIIAYKFAKEVDFFSIGTNDLTQYFLAVDRGNEMVANLYNSFNPAVLEAIQKVIDAAHGANINVSMCGEFAGDKRATKLLLGMGLDSFSMSASSGLTVKKIIRNSNYADAKKFRDLILQQDTPEEVVAKV